MATRCSSATSRGQIWIDLEPLTPRQVDVKVSDGALAVDVRTDEQLDEAHVPGVVCIPAPHAGFGTRLAWIADLEQEIVFVGRDDEEPGARRSSRRRCGSATSPGSFAAA